MANEKATVTKDGVTKTIQKKDLPDYIAMGWMVVNNYNPSPNLVKKVY